MEALRCFLILQKIFSQVIVFCALVLILSEVTVQAETEQKYIRTVENYVIPDVTLINQNGAKVRLKTLLTSDKPVLVDFIFTTCTTICPVLSANYSNFQRKLGPESAKVQLVSISIDPENDTPEAMKSYLEKRYAAKPGWDFLTGSKKDIDLVIKAFDAYSQNKMAHLPLILLRSMTDNRWIRIYGLIGTAELIKEYQKTLK